MDCSDFSKIANNASIINILKRLNFKVIIDGGEADLYFSLDPDINQEKIVSTEWLMKMINRGFYE